MTEPEDLDRARDCDWQDYLLPDPPARQRRTGWSYLPLVIAITVSIGGGIMLATKTIPQAALDAVEGEE